MRECRSKMSSSLCSSDKWRMSRIKRNKAEKTYLIAYDEKESGNNVERGRHTKPADRG